MYTKPAHVYLTFFSDNFNLLLDLNVIERRFSVGDALLTFDTTGSISCLFAERSLLDLGPSKAADKQQAFPTLRGSHSSAAELSR